MRSEQDNCNHFFSCQFLLATGQVWHSYVVKTTNCGNRNRIHTSVCYDCYSPQNLHFQMHLRHYSVLCRCVVNLPLSNNDASDDSLYDTGLQTLEWNDKTSNWNYELDIQSWELDNNISCLDHIYYTIHDITHLGNYTVTMTLEILNLEYSKQNEDWITFTFYTSVAFFSLYGLPDAVSTAFTRGWVITGPGPLTTAISTGGAATVPLVPFTPHTVDYAKVVKWTLIGIKIEN